uniref:Uncharacterized protein n=1 Tax=Caenorhabditis japonica TaxID=281687 RepID=A0A8R1I7B6_CAEJA
MCLDQAEKGGGGAPPPAAPPPPPPAAAPPPPPPPAAAPPPPAAAPPPVVKVPAPPHVQKDKGADSTADAPPEAKESTSKLNTVSGSTSTTNVSKSNGHGGLVRTIVCIVNVLFTVVVALWVLVLLTGLNVTKIGFIEKMFLNM